MIRRLAMGLVFFSFAFPTHGAVFTETHLDSKTNVASCVALLQAKTKPLTLSALREDAMRTTEKHHRLSPAPSFDFPEIAGETEQIGFMDATKFTKWVMPKNVGLTAAPIPTSPDPATIGIIDRKFAFTLQLQTVFAGRTFATTAYITLPGRLVAQEERTISDRWDKVQVWFHGWGTRGTGGHTSLEVGEALTVAAGVPTVSFDMIGHADGSKNLNGIETLHLQTLLYNRFLSELVSPKVKQHWAGHSGGGMVVLNAWQHQNDPEFRHIEEFVALSPPGDPSMGGDIEEKVKHAEFWAKEIDNHKHDGAKSDFQYRETILDQNKIAETGYLTLRLADYSYKVPPITWDEMKRKKRLTVVMGDKDIICWLPYREYFKKVFPSEMFVNFSDVGANWEKYLNDPDRPSRFYLLSEGQSFRTLEVGADELTSSGHQVQEYIIPGTINPDDRASGKKLVNEILWRGLTVDHDLKPFPIRDENGLDELLDFAVRAELRETVAREYLKFGSIFIRQNTREHKLVLGRTNELSNYVREYERIDKKRDTAVTAAVRQALRDLAQRSGVDRNTTIADAERRLGVERDEHGHVSRLSAVVGEDRKLFEDYVETRRLVEEEMARTWVDKEGVEKANEYFAKAAPALRALKISNNEFSERWPALQRDTRAEVKAQRNTLNTLAEDLSKLGRGFSDRFNRERDHRLNSRPRPPGMDMDVAQAKRRLNIDTDANSRAALENFLAEAYQVVDHAKNEVNAGLDGEIAALKTPGGVSSVEQAKKFIEDNKAMSEMVYVPEGNEPIGAIVQEVQRLFHSKPSLRELEKSEFELVELRQRRNTLISKFAGLMSLHGDKVVSSDALDAYLAPRDPMRAEYEARFAEFRGPQRRREIDLIRRKELTGERAAIMPPELVELRSHMMDAKARYLQFMGHLPSLQRSEALAGRLRGGANDAAAQAMAAAKELWGEPLDANLESRYQKKLADVEHRRRRVSEIDQQIGALKIMYVAELKAGHNIVPFEMHQITLDSLFNKMEPSELVKASQDTRKNRKKGEAAEAPESGFDADGSIQFRTVRKALEEFRSAYKAMQTDLSLMNKGAKPSGY